MRGLVLVTVLAAGCWSVPDAFHCDTDTQCDTGDPTHNGHCEDTGFCSADVAIAQCASGRRYLSYAGMYSGQCVPGTPADGGADGGSDLAGQ